MANLSLVEDVAKDLRDQLSTDVYGAVTAIADFADRYGGDRGLFFRALLLRRDLTLTNGLPSEQQVQEARSIISGVVDDYRRQIATQELTADARHARVEEKHSAALELQIPSEVVLACQDLTKEFRRTGFTLKNVSFELRLGEITGVMGRNGNGKTTMFRLVIGELAPTSGRISYGALAKRGRGWNHIRQQIAYVPQDLPRWFGSLKSNLHYTASVHGLRGAENRREVEYIVERLGLANELHKSWNELSGGFRLRFALGRAMVQKPKLLILDEPLANLDFETQEIVLEDLRQLTSSIWQPLAVLVSSQHVHEIEEVADNIVFLSDGEATYSGPTANIGAKRTLNRFEIGGNLDLATLQSALASEGVVSVHHSGVAFVVTTTLSVDFRDLLEQLLKANLPVDYCRDISCSTKSLFQQEAVSVPEFQVLARTTT